MWPPATQSVAPTSAALASAGRLGVPWNIRLTPGLLDKNLHTGQISGDLSANQRVG